MRATTDQFFDETGEPVGSVEARPEQIPDVRFLTTAFASDHQIELIRLSEKSEAKLTTSVGEVEGSFALAQRALDLTTSVALLIILLPLMLVITIAIKVSNGGPVIFAHRRVGRDGKGFDCLKFRTMHCGAEAGLPAILAANPQFEREWVQTQKLLEDPRVTPIGQFLRNTCLDELPQLFNVLRGEMALVGPRPIVGEELQRYGRHASSYVKVKPGLTGLWQVTRDTNTSYRRRIAADVLYVRNRSLTLDLKIILATVPAVLLGEGAC
jgi:lipopolysaccharide/colanic/teichoic acid biosynthesis glycosyltransferase